MLWVAQQEIKSRVKRDYKSFNDVNYRQQWYLVGGHFTDYLIIEARINYVDLACKSQKGVCLLKLSIVSVFQRRV